VSVREGPDPLARPDLAEVIFMAPLGIMVRRGDVQFVERSGWYQVLSESLKDPHYNEVVLSVVPDTEIAEVIDDVFATYERIGTAFKWCVGPPTRPLDMAERLRKRGARAADVALMACDTAALHIAYDSAITVTPIDEHNADELWFPVDFEGWHIAPENQSHRRDEVLWTLRNLGDSRRLFVASIDGRPVATTSFVLKDDGDTSLAYMSGGMVLPSYRGRGIYRALIEARLAALRSMGMRLAVTQARVETSAPILARLGFTEVARSHVFWCNESP